jgi:prepilin-type N-terminal cleavage/methylation domain-containing protein
MTKLYAHPMSGSAARRPVSQRASRAGLTLIEVMVSLTIITSALLGFGAFLTRFMHVNSQGTASSIAMDLAVSQVEAIKAYPTYANLEVTFNGTQSAFANCPGCVRTTRITRTVGASQDYKTVTVTVTVPALSSSYTAAPVAVPFTKTTTIAAF